MQRIIPERDQYGELIPQDLVELCAIKTGNHYTDIHTMRNDRGVLMSLPWYTDGKSILISEAELEQMWLDAEGWTYYEYKPNVPVEIVRVAEPLKRYNYIDGFYHA